MSEMDELAGRIEAVARLAMNVVAELEDAGLLDGVRFADRMRAGATKPSAATDARQATVLEAAGRTLWQLADSIDDSRVRRQAQVR